MDQDMINDMHGSLDTVRVAEDKRILNRAGLALFILAVVFLGVQTIITAVVSRVNPALLEADWYIWVVTIMSISVIGFGVFYLFIRYVPASNQGEVVKISKLKLCMYFVICTGGGYLFNLIGVIYTTLITMITGKEILNPVIDVMSDSNIIATILYVGILAPIVEELIFRKLLLDRLKRFGDIPAILISGIAFGLFHMNLSQFIYATALGILYGYIAIRTNSVRYVIILHMANNLMATIIGIIALNNLVLTLLSTMWMLFAIAAAIALVVINHKQIILIPVYNKTLRKRDYFTSPGWCLYWVICIVIIVVSFLG